MNYGKMNSYWNYKVFTNYEIFLGIVFGNSDDPFKDISLNGKKLCKTPITDDIDID